MDVLSLKKSISSQIVLFALLFFSACVQSQEKERSPEDIEEKEESEIHTSFDLNKLDAESLNDKVDSISNDKATFSDVVLFEDSIKKLFLQISGDSVGLDFKVFRYGMIGFYSLKQDNRLNDKNLLSIIDYTKSSCEKRFYTIDLRNKQIIFNTYVSHGRNTGADTARNFSDKPQSFKSSIGFYVTGEAYTGSKGYSMRLDGDEIGYNSNIRKRAIVMHNADYVSEKWIKRYGRIGRSLGCPVLPKGISKNVINSIKDKTAIFAYYNDDKYLNASKYLNLERLINRLGLEVEED